MAKGKSGLGRGLGALIGDNGTTPHQPSTTGTTQTKQHTETRPIEAKPSVPKEPEKKAPASAPQQTRQTTKESQAKPKAAPAPTRESETLIAERAKVTTRPSVTSGSWSTGASNLTTRDDIRRALKEEHKNMRSYVEEDDHVTIKGVVERDIKPDDKVKIELIKPNPDQPRTNFDETELDELADSIKKNGLLQPILVRKVGNMYQIIAGERRWQAAKRAGLQTVPINLIKADDDKVIELALIENIQRTDLNPIEEAYGYRRLMDRRGMTQSEVALAVSKGRSTIANSLRLLELPEDAQQLLFENKITAGHARAILSVPTKAGREKLTERLLQQNMSVRDAENYARLLSGKKPEQGTRVSIPKSYRVVAKNLSDALGVPVRVRNAKGKNKIEIEFKDQDELEALFDSLLGAEKEDA